jgi:hypothetical protein
MGKISKEKVEELKKQHRVVAAIEVEDNGETFHCYLKRPSAETLAIVNKLSKTDEIRAAKTLVEQCWIEGDSIIREDGILMLAVAAEFGKSNTARATIIKNE